MLKIIIITVLAVQLVNTIVAMVMSDEEKYVYIAGGIPAIILSLFFMLIRKIMQEYRKAKYKALLMDDEGKLCYCNSIDEPDVLINNGFQWATTVQYTHSVADGWRKKDCAFGDVINIRYSPIKVIKKMGAYPIDKKTIKECKKNTYW